MVDSELGFEAKQLKELVFRENADLLYAREQPPSTTQTMFTATLSDFAADDISLGFPTDMSFMDLFDLSESTLFPALDSEMGEMAEQTSFPEPTAPTQGKDLSSSESAVSLIDQTQLRTALERIPVCTHCKRRRVKCDKALPACRNCKKLNKDCYFMDSALGKETSRRSVFKGSVHVLAKLTRT